MRAAAKRARGSYDLLVQNTPDAMKEAPEILPGLDIYMEAFLELTAHRGSGAGGPNAISFTDLDTWARRNDFNTEEEFATLGLYIRHLDGVYLKHVASKAKK